MEKLTRKNTTIVIMIIAISIISPACVLFDEIRTEGKEYEETIRDEVYSFDITKLEEDLVAGKISNYTLESSNPTAIPLNQGIEDINWDPHKIIDAIGNIYLYLYHETISDDALSGMTFYTSCKDKIDGANYARLTYYHQITKEDTKIKNIRSLSIDLRNRVFFVYEGNYEPEWDKPATFKYSDLNYGYKDLLTLVDKEVGWQFRKVVNNNCNITAEYNPYDKQWVVRYTEPGIENKQDMRVVIDQTGRFLSIKYGY